MADISLRLDIPDHTASVLRQIAGTPDTNEAAREVLRQATLPADAQVKRALRQASGEKVFTSPKDDPTKAFREMFARIDAKQAKAGRARRK